MRKIEGFCKIHFFRGGGARFSVKICEIRFFALQAAFFHQISQFMVCDLLLGG